MSTVSVPSDVAILDIEGTNGTPDEKGSRKSVQTVSESLPSTSFAMTEVDEFSVKPVHYDPLLPYEQVEDRSEIKPVTYNSKACFLNRFASGLDQPLMFFASICGIGAGVSYVAHMYILGEIVDVFTRASDTNDVFRLIGRSSIYYVILTVCICLLSSLNMYLWCLVKERQLIRIRQILVQTLFRNDIGWFDHQDATKICSTGFSDIEQFGRGIGETFAMSIQWLSAVFALLINAIVQSPDVTGVIFPYFPCIILAAVGSFWITKSYRNREKESKNLVKTALLPVLENIRIISAFQSQDFELRRLFRKIKFARIMTFRKYLCFGIKNGSFWMLAFFTVATGGWYGSYLILQGRVSPGKTVQSILGLLMSAIFVGQFYPCLECIMKAKEAADNLTRILDEVPFISQNRKKGKDLPVSITDIEFAGVYFSYPSPPDQRVLGGLQLTINANETVALVGPSGGGKSTVLKLILRFYDPKIGKVYINGMDAQDLKLEHLRRHIGFVGNDPSLFAISIADNIRLGHEAVTTEQIIYAAKLANAHDFIMDLPQGYNTIVDKDGVNLKDDEKLRIALARALVRNPKILLLDEVTSTLDTASEGIVLEAIEKARQGRTTVITSHRLINVQEADTIAVIQNGRVFEQGNHKELMQKGGLYCEMWTVQSCIPKGKMCDYIFEIREDYRKKKGSWNKKQWMAVYSHRTNESKQKQDQSCEDLGPTVENNEQVPKWNFSLMKRLLKLNFPDWSYSVIGSITSLVVGVIGPLFALLLAEFIYVFSITNADIQYTKRRNLAAQLMVVGAFLAPVNYLQNFCFAQIESKLTMSLRDMLAKVFFKQDMSFHDNPQNNRGKLINTFMEDTVDINGATGLKLAMIIQAPATIIACIVISFLYSWQLALPMLGIFLPSLIIVSYYSGRLYWPEKVWDVNKYHKLIEKTTKDVFSNIKTVAVLVKEDYFTRKYQEIFKNMYKKKIFEALKFGILFGLSEGFVFCAYAVTFSIGSYLVHRGETTFPNVFRVLGSVVIGAIMTGRMCWNTPNFRKGMIAAKRLLPLVENVLDDSAKEEENESLEPCKGAVSFENVTFSDPTQPDVTILKNFSLSIKSGGTVAVVGAKEAEKKAIIELMERFYKPISGTITLDNVDLQNQRLDWLRSQLCVLKQEALFADVSITDNILYGSTSGINEVIDACKLLNIHDFFTSLPAGYNTKLEEIVLPFHPQRLVIARALVRNSQIVFVDCECLSLNAPGEEEIQETLFRSLEEKTLIIMSNHVSLVENANRIVVIDQGRVVESGAHDDLTETDGIYSRLVRSQRNLKELL